MAKTSYQIITDQIIQKMEQGIIPWVKPWHTDTWSFPGMCPLFPAFSYNNGKPYNFLNQMLLGFEPGEFATFNQIKKAGGKVKKGEKAVVIAGWIVEDKPLKDEDGDNVLDDNGDVVMRKTFALRYYQVFNILTQVEGLEPKHPWINDAAPNIEHDPIEAAENIIDGYINSVDAPKLIYKDGSKRAYYSPLEDTVVLPIKSQFDTVEGFYGTAFHELTHSTLKESRCNRKHEGKKVAKGDKEYSKEELVAEIGSCFLSNTAGLDISKTFDNTVAYLQSWITVLKNDPKMIVQASTQAEKAAEFILNAPAAMPFC